MSLPINLLITTLLIYVVGAFISLAVRRNFGQWHSLSDPELEHSLITRIDFNLFCRFDELSIPDYSTLCRYRNWLAQDDTLSELLQLINRQLTEKNLKVEKASATKKKKIKNRLFLKKFRKKTPN